MLRIALFFTDIEEKDCTDLLIRDVCKYMPKGSKESVTKLIVLELECFLTKS